MLLNRTNEGEIICPRCESQDNIIIHDNEPVSYSVWYKIRLMFLYFGINNSLRDSFIGFYVVKIFKCNVCGFKVVDKEFVSMDASRYGGKRL